MSFRVRLIAVGVLALAGCLDRFETESAYSGERYLCEVAMASTFNDAVERCRAAWEANRLCAGVLSITGTLEGKPLTVETDLTRTAFTFRGEAATGRRVDRVEMRGASPYFALSVDMRSVGVEVGPGASGRGFALDSGAEERPNGSEDDLLALVFRTSVGGESVAHAARTGTVSFSPSARSERELSGRMDARFGPGDAVEGCYHAFATEQLTARGGS